MKLLTYIKNFFKGIQISKQEHPTYDELMRTKKFITVVTYIKSNGIKDKNSNQIKFDDISFNEVYSEQYIYYKNRKIIMSGNAYISPFNQECYELLNELYDRLDEMDK